TASTESVNFIEPITVDDSVCIESFVAYTGRSSMERSCKVTAEDMVTAKRRIAATAFLTFVALAVNNKPTEVPGSIPATEEEQYRYESGKERAKIRKLKREQHKELISKLTVAKPWD